MATDNQFYIFKGNGKQHDGLRDLPPAPPWRSFVKSGEKDRLDPKESRPSEEGTAWEAEIAAAFQIDEQNLIRDAVNAALFLRRPLLVTGRAGTGKSSIVRAVARELKLGPVLVWNITSRSSLKDGLYEYDSLGRLQEIQERQSQKNQEKVPVADFITLGPLGTALLPARWPKALLIDEIDKADLDLPNDLLTLFEGGSFVIPELERDSDSAKAKVRTWKNFYGKQMIEGGHVGCRAFPFVVLTNNGEREFSPAFLRRCVRLDVPPPDENMLARIVKAHFKKNLKPHLTATIREFIERGKKRQLATDQLLNTIFLLESTELSPEDRTQLVDLLYRELI